MDWQKEIAHNFNIAIQALRENREYKQLGTLEEVREAEEKQKRKNHAQAIDVMFALAVGW